MFRGFWWGSGVFRVIPGGGFRWFSGGFRVGSGFTNTQCKHIKNALKVV